MLLLRLARHCRRRLGGDHAGGTRGDGETVRELRLPYRRGRRPPAAERTPAPAVACAPARVRDGFRGAARRGACSRHALTEVPGIGRARARKLARLGIVTAERLARADPAVIARILGHVTVRTAKTFVEDAESIVTDVTVRG